MPLPDWSGTRLAFVAETAFGVTPATPTFTTFRATQAGGLSTRKTTGKSEEIRADRNVTDEFQLAQDCAGDYPVELSYGSFDDLLAAGFFGDWTANVLKNGITRKSVLFEETSRLSPSSLSFSRFAGSMVNRIELQIRARQKIEATFGLMAQKETLDTAIVTGATYTAAATSQVLTASANVAALSVAGLASPKVKSMSMVLNNNLRVRDIVGSLYTEEFGAGQCDVTGELELYFDSNATYQKFLDHGGGSLSVTMGAVANQRYKLDLPKIILTEGQKPAGGNSDDIMVRTSYRAVYDTTEACSAKLTRAVA